MAEDKNERKTPAGLYDRDDTDSVTAVEVVALVLTVIWVFISGGYILFGQNAEGTGLQFLLNLMIIVMPVALIWVAAVSARSSRIMRAESARLQAAIDAIRQAYVAQAQKGRNEQPHPALMKRLDQLAAGQKNLETTMAMVGAARTANAAPQPIVETVPQEEVSSHQPDLALGTPAEALQPPLANTDFIRALNFPETAEDVEGFNALRRALKDRGAAQMVQAAQDILTLLSQDGIYMDDLRPDLARPEVWRAFAQGTRGRAIASLGGVRDRSSLALAAGRMKQDPIFRDAAHHFLRRFDRSFAAFEPNATDEEITDFAGTRSARAFMLLGRVAGTFD